MKTHRKFFFLSFLFFFTVMTALPLISNSNVINAHFGIKLTPDMMADLWTLNNVTLPWAQPPSVGNPDLQNSFRNWVNIVPLYYQDVSNLTYWGEFSSGLLNDPNIQGPPIGLYAGYPDVIGSDYVAQVETDKGTLFMNRYTIQFQLMYYTRESFSDIFGNIERQAETVDLFKIYERNGKYRVTASEQMDIPYYDLNDSVFTNLGSKAKDGTIVLQMFVDTSGAGSFFHNINITGSINGVPNQNIGTLAFTDDTYAYIESIVPKNWTGGLVQTNREDIIRTLGSLPPTQADGEFTLADFGTQGGTDWSRIWNDAETNATPYNVNQHSQTISREALGVTTTWYVQGYYITPPTVVTQQLGHQLSAPPINAQVPTYVMQYDQNATNITSRGKSYDPNLLDLYGNIDTVLWGTNVLLRPQVQKFNVLHSWSYGYLDWDWWGWMTWAPVYEPSTLKTYSSCAGWAVDNAYIIQNWTASIIVGAYYDWQPISPDIGPLGNLRVDEGNNIFINIPTGALRGGAGAEPAPPEGMLALFRIAMQAAGLGDPFAENGLFGNKKGSVLDTLWNVVIVIVIIAIVVIVLWLVIKKTKGKPPSGQLISPTGQVIPLSTAVALSEEQLVMQGASPEAIHELGEVKKEQAKWQMVTKIAKYATIGTIIAVILFIVFTVVFPILFPPKIPSELLGLLGSYGGLI